MGAKDHVMESSPRCWCGNYDLTFFTPTYLKCMDCETLVWVHVDKVKDAKVTDDSTDFYGKNYWFDHQTKDLDQPDILTRARTDLPERCLYWLRTVLKYRLPPGSILEIGCGHGGLVALLSWSGFHASGLELNTWVVEFCSNAFGIPTMVGPIEEQRIKPQSLDVIILLDVLEHFQDPIGTMRHCLSLLKPNGIFVVQTPCLPKNKAYKDLLETEDRFLEQLKDRDHLFLFSQSSIRKFFSQLGCNHLEIEPAIFSHYDMFLVASQQPLISNTTETIENHLSMSSNGRMVQAMLDLGSQRDTFEKEVHAIRHNLSNLEKNQAQHIELIKHQEEQLAELVQRQEKQLTDLALYQDRQLANLEVELQNLRSFVQRILSSRVIKFLRLIWYRDWEVPNFDLTQGKVCPQSSEEKTFISTVQRIRQSTDYIEKAKTFFPKRGNSKRSNFQSCFDQIRDPKKLGYIVCNDECESQIIQQFQDLGFQMIDCDIDVNDYKNYLSKACYFQDFPSYYPDNLPEKSLEHYIAAKLLKLKREDTYIDIASERSPVPDLYRRVFGVEQTYRQDLSYPEGLHGDKIGGSAARMPLPDEFATKMALHCSLEHFEEDSDSSFICEVQRLLKPGGLVCIVPLYLFSEYAIQTDPEISVPIKVSFDHHAIVYCAENWKNRFGRFYDPIQLKRRLVASAGNLNFTIYRFNNVRDVDKSCYLKFALVLEKPL